MLRLFGTATTKALVEPVYPAAGIKYLLLAGVKWMALGTHINVKIFTGSGTGLNLVTTATGRRDVFVLGMYISFHNEAPYQ